MPRNHFTRRDTLIPEATSQTPLTSHRSYTNAGALRRLHLPSDSSIKRRKVDSSAIRTGSGNRGIVAFTKVSKSQIISKSLYDKNVATTTDIDTVNTFGKRKLQPVDNHGAGQVPEQASVLVTSKINATDREIRPLPQRRSVSAPHLLKTPQRPIVTIISPVPTPGSVDTPSNSARNLLNNLCLKSSPSSSQLSSFNGSEINLDSSQTTVSSQSAPFSDELPAELTDLANLHSSFLTALTLHYAHNGTHSPADIRLLCPNVARTWGKRRVVLEDVKRILAILNLHPRHSSSGSQPHLYLSDYGQGKICVEIRVSGRADRVAKPLDENAMNAAFTANLEGLWRESSAQNAEDFISTLPLEPVKMCSSASKMSPLLAKGQRRLEDMRAGVTIRKAADEAKENEAKKLDAAGNRPTLLERLRAKALLKANAPAGPSKEELARRATLGRLEEAVAILTLLSTSGSAGQSRVSFTIPTVLGKLKDSFRTPMSAKEGEDCLRLLAGEIAPSWLKIAKMGKTEAVVVMREARPSDQVIKERINMAA